ncbi:MAG: alpha/beta fold hydrolase [Cyclobacteriaceae bacterium]
MKKSFITLQIILVMTQLAFSQNGGISHRISVEGNYQLSAIDYPGEGIPYLLLHGFPDNSIIYNKLIAELQKNGKRCIAFDFMGWGDSDKPKNKNYLYSVKQQEIEIQSVVDFFELEAVRLVVHDMAGPPAIDFAIGNESKVEELILLNTYYHSTKSRREPPTITMFSAPVLKYMFTTFGKLNFVFKPVFKTQMKPFFNDEDIRQEYVSKFLPQFLEKEHSKNALFKIIRQVPQDVKQNKEKLATLKGFQKPVKVIFGSTDKYLGVDLAREFASIFPNAKLHLVDKCNHYPQIEYPLLVTEILIENPISSLSNYQEPVK